MSKKRARSAITGRFVSLLYALRHPRTTILERRTRPDTTKDTPPPPSEKR